MSLSPLANVLAPSLANAAAVLNPAGKELPRQASERAGEALAQAGAMNAADKSRDKSADTVSTDKEGGERVSLTPIQEAEQRAAQFAAPFAEIWKDGRKLAEVDVRGEVRGVAGVIAGLPAGGSGLTVAATRAAVLAQSLGGEIRSAGIVTDARTLAMRSRLQATYTA
jgi:hypothetical protein